VSSKRVRLALIGAPGSGKGTQGAILAEHLGVPLISSGELLRAAAAGQGVSPEVAAQLARGELVPDDVVLAIVNAAIERAGETGGYVLDGFPRTISQAEHAAAPMLDAVVHLDLSDDVARERLAGRAGAGRADDLDREAIERRLRRYHDETEPLLTLYRERGMLRTVDADRPPEAVTAAVLDALAPSET
jgi:adenylate kinase